MGTHLPAGAAAAPARQRWEGGRLLLGPHSVTQERNISEKQKQSTEIITIIIIKKTRALGVKVHVCVCVSNESMAATCRLHSGSLAAPGRTGISCAPANDARLRQASGIHLPAWKICLGSLNEARLSTSTFLRHCKRTLQWR